MQEKMNKSPRLNAKRIVALITRVLSHPATKRAGRFIKDEFELTLRRRLKNANAIKAQQYNSKNRNTSKL